jgi:hypothetical protein
MTCGVFANPFMDDNIFGRGYQGIGYYHHTTQESYVILEQPIRGPSRNGAQLQQVLGRNVYMWHGTSEMYSRSGSSIGRAERCVPKGRRTGWSCWNFGARLWRRRMRWVRVRVIDLE